MPGPLLVLKAFQLKKAVKRLMVAKQNALRIHRGERPRYPWYEECWTWFTNCTKNFFCQSFCPCCISDSAEGFDNYSENCLRRQCLPGTFENYIIKSILGFLLGCCMTIGIFLFMVNQLNLDPRVTTLICSAIGLLLTIGLSFSDSARCVTLLVLPELFSNRGRIVLLAYGYVLVMSGPAKNAIRNSNVLIESMNCGQELIANQTKAILRSIFAPIIAIIDAVRDIIAALKDFARQMKEAFIAIKDMFLEIIAAIKQMFGWILSIVKVCSNKYGSPYERCTKAFDDAIEDCKYRLGFFGFLCLIVSAIKFVCEIARIVDLLCMIPRMIKTGIIEPLKEQIEKFTRYMYNQFYVNVTLIHYYNYSFEQSKTYEEIRGDINEEIRRRSEWLTSMIDFSDLVMSMFMLTIVFKALLYRFKYRRADHFDNIYITYHVRDIDDRRAVMGKEIIFPLSFRERKKYINTFSILMGKTERRRLLLNGTLLIVTGVQMGFYLLLDYSLNRFLKMLRFHGRVTAKGGLPSHVAMSVKGDGVMADMYKKVITAFDPLLGVVPDFDTSECLPNPVPIDLDRYQQIGIMYCICFILTITESYGLRLRHVVCGIFHPDREKHRAVWLYNHILRTRGGLLKFLRRKIRRRFYGDTTIQKVSLVDRLAFQFRFVGRLLKACGYIRVYCICCNEPGIPDDYDNFKRCATPGCKGLYCLSCFDELKSECSLCLKPIEYGDLSDVSEEFDSSDESGELIETVGISDDDTSNNSADDDVEKNSKKIIKKKPPLNADTEKTDIIKRK